MYDVKNNFQIIVDDYNRNLNLKSIYEELYYTIVNQGYKGFLNIDDFEQACYYVIKICLQYDDYINSNNILQCYKLNKKSIDKPEWYYIYSAKIYGRRTTNYFLDKPEKLKDKLAKVSTNAGDSILCDLLSFYFNNLYLKNKKEYLGKIQNFIAVFSNSDYCQFSKATVKFNDYIEGKILEDDFSFDYVIEQVKTNGEIAVEKTTLKLEKKEDSIYNYYDGITEPSILILGKSEIGVNQIYSICKCHGFDKKHVYMELEYDKIPKVDISKYQYNVNNRNCIGFILGPMPHSHTNKGDFSSLAAYLQATEGYPMIYECRANNQSSELKLTKKNLNQALDAIVANFNSINN